MTEYLNCETTSLLYGDKGKEVTLLQTHLKSLGYYTYYNGSYLSIDGKFLKYTEWAVKKFQRATGHDDDGWFGPKTCQSLNQLLMKRDGITTTMTTTSTGGTNATGTTATKTSNPYQIDTTKNVLQKKDANLHIGGLHFLMTSINFDSFSNTGDFKSIALLSGRFKNYWDHDVQREYTVETELTLEEFKQLEPELVKMEHQVCYVVCPYFASGNFNVKVTPSLKNVRYIRLSMKLREDY